MVKYINIIYVSAYIDNEQLGYYRSEITTEKSVWCEWQQINTR